MLIFLPALIFSAGSHGQSVTPADSMNHEIFRTIRLGSADKLESLLLKGANPNSVDDGYSALMAATLTGTSEQMELLIRYGAAVNYMDSDGITALWFSVPDYHKTALLLNHGADPQLHSKEGFTVLVKLANFPGTEKLFHLLMDHGADPRQSGPDNSLLYNAASSCDTAILGLLLRSGLRVNDTTSVGDYPVNSALNFRCFSTLKMLVDNGANVNVVPMHIPLDLLNGITPLMFAAVSNDSLSFFYLLAHGADPNARSKRGYTVLMFVQQAEKEEQAMTQALIDRGANPLEKAPDGTDALSLARQKGNTQTVELLRKYTINK
jgi:ankyrin repeat protein